MATLAEKIAETLERYHVGFMQKKVLKTVEEIEATTDPLAKYVAGAGTVGELYNNLTFPDGVRFYPDVHDGKRGYNTDAARGADTFFPFSSGELIFLQSASGTYKNLTLNFENPFKKEILSCFGYPSGNSAQFFMYDFVHAEGHAIRSISKTDTSITLVRTNDSTSAVRYEAWVVLA